MFGRNISIIAIVVFIGIAAVPSISAKTKSLAFVIEPVAGAKARFRVSVSFAGDADGTTDLNLPNEWGGQTELYKAVQDLKATNATIADTDRPHVKSLAHRPSELVTVTYEIVQDFEGPLRNNIRYRPVVGNDFVHWIGYTVWALPAWDDKDETSVSFEWRNLPDSWTVANSFGTGKRKQKFRTEFANIAQSITIAGDFRLASTIADGKAVDVAVRGKWLFADNELAEMIRKVIQTERSFWKDNSQDHFLVTLVPLDDRNSYSFGGTGLTDSFALFATPNATVDRIRGLLAHEYFHNWNPTKLGRMPDPEQQMYWFSEGFTEFYAYLLLLRGGLISLDEYVAKYNEMIREYYLLPVRNDPNERIIKDFWNDQNVQRLPYLRGFLLATNWNAAIKNASGGKHSLDDVMRDLARESRKTKLPLNENTFNEVVKRYLGGDLSQQIKRFAIDGELAAPMTNALGPSIELESKDIPIFELGFDSEPLFKTKTIANVKPDSAAFEAGLRDGQKVVGGISINFGNTSREIQLKVKDETGEKTVKFVPVARKRLTVPQFKVRDGITTGQRTDGLLWLGVKTAAR